MTTKLVLLLGMLVVSANLVAADWKWSEYGLAKTDTPSAIPTAYPKGDWKWKWYADFKKNDYRNWGVNVIFLGDSITYGWNYQKKYPDGSAVLKKYRKLYPKVRPFSLGVSGDKTENTLWLVTEGQVLEKFNTPKVIVLMIGINSLNAKAASKHVAEGIKNIITVLKQQQPDTKILLLGILPCWGRNAPVRAKIKETNQLIKTYADNKTVYFLTFGDKLLKPNGNMKSELTYDGIHLTEKGYELWAGIMFPYLQDLVVNQGAGDIWQKANQVKEVKK